jgi:CRP-like cAMP-binding protein
MFQTLERHEVLFEADDPAPALYLVVEGQIKVSLYGLHGDETILNLLGAGELLGELSIFGADARRSATATAIEPTTVLAVPRGVFLRFLRDNPEVTIRLLGGLAGQIRRLSQLVDDTYHLGLEQRLAKRLLDLASARARVRDTSLDLSVCLTQAELANMLGATRESVNKVLRSYCARGIVDAGRSHIRVLRLDALRRLAGEGSSTVAP